MENDAADGGDAVLDALSAAAGIAPSFHDIWGREYAASNETRCALLQALGYRVDTEADQRAALAFVQNRPWSRLIDPVVVIASEAGQYTVDVAVVDGKEDLSWTIRTEDGRVLHGDASYAVLPVLDKRPDIPGRGAVTRYRLDLRTALPEGYHQLVIVDGGGSRGDTTLIVAPPRCWTPRDATGDARLWGISCQLYSLTEEGDDGIGTFSHLKRFATGMAKAGADTIGLNPLHSLYPVEPDAASPYSPSSRDFLNPLYIDIHAIPEAGSTDLSQLPAVGEQADHLIDYDAVARRAWCGLEAVFATFRCLHPEGGSSDREGAFRTFRNGGSGAGASAEVQSRALYDFALFMAIQEDKAGGNLSSMPWWAWGEAFAHPEAPGSRAFADTHRERVRFHQWCQFIADEQLGDAASTADAAGLRMGLYRDLAIGVGPASAAAWADPQALVRGVSVGAPPDLLNRKGQDWGLAPLDPLYLRETAFKPLIQGLRANMRHAGAIRIDHVMGLMHLYWIPTGRPADEGTYVSYPFDEMLRILALESRRHKAIVIGEDLGTVPEGFRDRMTAAGVLSYKVMPFERVGDGLFKRGTTYSPLSVCTFGTHDLPTVDGWWSGHDVTWRSHLGHHGNEEDRDADMRSRAADRQRLIDALVDAGVWPPDRPVDTGTPERMSQPLREAIHAFLARTDSCLMVVQIEDALALVDQMNLPGTTTEHPNWRRRLPRAVSAIADTPSVRGVLDAVATVRGRNGVGGENA